MGLRFGIGGGAFGVRGGISNRGIGGGVGPFSVGSSWGGHRRRSRRAGSGGGGVATFIIVLVVGGLVSLCSHQDHTSTSAPPIAKPLPAGCFGQPPTVGPGNGVALANVTFPDLTGAKGGAAERCLKNLGFTETEIDFESANPAYKSVWEPANWTVVNTYPTPGSVVNVNDPYARVLVSVTKE